MVEKVGSSFPGVTVVFSFSFCLFKGNGTIERAEYELHFDMQEPTLAIVANGMFAEFDADQSSHIDMTDLENMYNRMDLNSKISYNYFY